jgi:hypothetical protein
VLHDKTRGIMEAVADPNSDFCLGLAELHDGYPLPSAPSGRPVAPCTLAWRSDPRNPDLVTLSPVSHLGLDLPPMEPCTLAIRSLCARVGDLLGSAGVAHEWEGGVRVRARRGDAPRPAGGRNTRAAWEEADADIAAGIATEVTAALDRGLVEAASAAAAASTVAAQPEAALAGAARPAAVPAVAPAGAAQPAAAPAVAVQPAAVPATAGQPAAVPAAAAQPAAVHAVAQPALVPMAAVMPAGVDAAALATPVAPAPGLTDAQARRLAGLAATASRAMLHADEVGASACRNMRAYEAALKAGDVDAAQLRRLEHMAQQSAMAKLEANQIRNAAGNALKHARGLPGYEPLTLASYATVTAGPSSAERDAAADLAAAGQRGGKGGGGDDQAQRDAGATRRAPPRHAPARASVDLGDALAPANIPPRDPPVRWEGPWAEHRDGRWSYRGRGERRVQDRDGRWIPCDPDGYWRRSAGGLNRWALGHDDRWRQCPGGGIPDGELPRWRESVCPIAPGAKKAALPPRDGPDGPAGPAGGSASPASTARKNAPSAVGPPAHGGQRGAGRGGRQRKPPGVPGQYGPLDPSDGGASPRGDSPKRSRTASPPTQTGDHAAGLAVPVAPAGDGDAVGAHALDVDVGVGLDSESGSDSSWSRRSRTTRRARRGDDSDDNADDADLSDDDVGGRPSMLLARASPAPDASGIEGLDDADFHFGDLDGCTEADGLVDGADAGEPYSDYGAGPVEADDAGDSMPIGAPATTVTDDDLDAGCSMPGGGTMPGAVTRGRLVGLMGLPSLFPAAPGGRGVTRPIGAPVTTVSDDSLDATGMPPPRAHGWRLLPLVARARRLSATWATKPWFGRASPGPAGGDVVPCEEGGAPSLPCDDAERDTASTGRSSVTSTSTMSSVARVGAAWFADVVNRGPASSRGSGSGSHPSPTDGATGADTAVDTDDDSMPGLLVDDVEAASLPEGTCPLPSAAGMADAIEAARERMGVVDLAWCGTLQLTADYLGASLHQLLLELSPVASISLHGVVVSLTWQVVSDAVTDHCNRAHSARAAYAAAEAAALLAAAQARHAAFTAAASSSVLIQHAGTRLQAALAHGGAAGLEAIYLDVLFAAALDAVSFYGTARGPWWRTFSLQIRVVLDRISIRDGYLSFAERVDSIVGAGGISCAHEGCWAAMANPAAVFDGRRASEPAWGASGQPGDYYEALHRLTHSMRIGAMGDAGTSLAHDRGATDRGLGTLAAHARQLHAELDALGAHIVTESGAASVDRGASWSYLVESAGRAARQRTWRARMMADWHVDDTCPNALADAASRGARPVPPASDGLVPYSFLGDHIPGRDVELPRTRGLDDPAPID